MKEKIFSVVKSSPTCSVMATSEMVNWVIIIIAITTANVVCLVYSLPQTYHLLPLRPLLCSLPRKVSLVLVELHICTQTVISTNCTLQ